MMVLDDNALMPKVVFSVSQSYRVSRNCNKLTRSSNFLFRTPFVIFNSTL